MNLWILIQWGHKRSKDKVYLVIQQNFIRLCSIFQTTKQSKYTKCIYQPHTNTLKITFLGSALNKNKIPRFVCLKEKENFNTKASYNGL